MGGLDGRAELTVFAPAKVNFGLGVLGVRADGYHDLHSLMVPLAVGDELVVAVERGVVGPDVQLSVEGAALPTDERNLVFRAARAYLRSAGGAADGAAVRVLLRKRLPLASGVGGGSSDAAATLLALARLLPAELDLPVVARQLGADVPFFLVGGAAVAEGIGEVLTPVSLPQVHVVLVNPGVEVSAGEAYGWLDASGDFTGPLDVPGVLGALDGGPSVPYFNALQGPVVARHPVIGLVLRSLEEVGLRSPLMSGSGSTCFALAGSAVQAQRAARALQAARPEWWVRATWTVGGAPRPDLA